MEVKLKHHSMQQASPSCSDPFGRTLEVYWEVVDDSFGWTDPNNEYDKIVHIIRPVALEKSHRVVYERR